ncbi:MAG: DUF6090 family protein [Balneola sp.]
MEQNKVRTYIFYALGEIFLVMIGILLALQINNWNEDRKEREREVSYLIRLNENLIHDGIKMEGRINFFGQIQEYSSVAIPFLEGNPPPEKTDWDILLALFQSSQIWPLILSNSTYDELKSAGELSLIRNEELRTKLANYYGENNTQYENTVGILPEYRQAIRGKIPLYIQDIIWERCHEITEDDWQVLLNCESGLSESEIKPVLKKIFQEDTILEYLRFWMSNLTVGIDIIQNQKVLGEEAIQLVNQELEQFN